MRNNCFDDEAEHINYFHTNRSTMMDRNTQLMLMMIALTLFAGCDKQTQQPSNEPVPTPTAKQDNGEEGHSHGTGPHGGTVADWGGGEYHVEFTVDHDAQQATVYILGSDAKSAAPIIADKLLVSISEPFFQADLLPSPLDGETEGKSSRFIGKNEKLGIVQEFAGTISGEVNGTPYAGDFKEEPHAD